jgi:uncharacterized Zn finger protein
VITDPYLCPKCGAKGRVVDSKKRKGYRYRSHECSRCGLHWPSYHSRLNVRREIRRILSKRAPTTVQKSTHS